MPDPGLTRVYLEALKGVCRRPPMCTPNGTFHEVAAFITGMQVAIGRLHPDMPDPVGAIGFRQWLAFRYRHLRGDMGNLAWFEYVRAASPDERSAVENILKLYTEYLASEFPDTAPDANL